MALSLKKSIISLAVIISTAIVASNVMAGPLDTSSGAYTQQQAQRNAFNKEAGFTSTATIGSVVAIAVKAFLGFLGVIFIVLIVLSGYNWMTANGDDQKISKAQETIKAAVIGLIIILAAYSITYFVFKSLGGPGGPVGGGT